MSETTTLTVPAIGQPWTDQGGIYVGSSLVGGETHHLIIPGGPEFDIEASHNTGPERIAAKGEINGFSDWRHGSQEDVMLAYINVRDLFPRKGFESIQVTSTPSGSDGAWVVDFEDGNVRTRFRGYELRVRPFRSIIASSL